jgi:hypothetical protein
MDNVQKRNICSNVPPSQNFRLFITGHVIRISLHRGKNKNVSYRQICSFQGREYKMIILKCERLKQRPPKTTRLVYHQAA